MKRWTKINIAVALGLVGGVAWLVAQNTAAFPGRAVTTADLFIASNYAATTLTLGISSTATSATVASGTGFLAPQLVTIDNEIINVCQISGNTLTFGKSSCPNVDGRAYDGSSAASHLAGRAVQGRVVAWLHNQVSAELIAIEAKLHNENVSVIDGGAKGDCSTDDTTAIQAVITARGSAGGGNVIFPTPAGGCYKITSTISVPQGVQLWMNHSPIHSFVSSAPSFKMGTTTSGYDFNISIHQLSLYLETDSAMGVQWASTANAVLDDFYIQGNAASNTRGNVCLNYHAVYNGNETGKASNGFCNHVKKALLADESNPGSAPFNTSWTVTAVIAQEDSLSGSVGVELHHLSVSNFLSLYLEATAQAIIANEASGQGSSGINFFGTTFEGNAADVLLGTYDSSFTLVGSMGLDNYVDNSGGGFGNHTLFGNYNSSFVPLRNEAPFGIRAFMQTDGVPFSARVPNAGTQDLLQLDYVSSGQLFRIDHSGEIYQLAGANVKITAYGGSPEGVVTAPIGSLCANTAAGTLYVKNSGSGNTGWKLVTQS